MDGPPPPWFFIAIFPVMAVSAGIVIRSIGNAVARLREAKAPVQLPSPAPEPRMAEMQAEIDELRMQVERLTAAQSFYAQLQPPATAAREALPGGAGAPLS